MNQNISLVSICCITYNHENFIRETIDGFLIQKTRFPIEIIIHDDCSTDNTASIILEYQKLHPNITTIIQTENQYSQGIDTLAIALSHAKGAYIALCEGDDYWTDANKINTQVELLENNKEIDICAHLASKNGITVPCNGLNERFSVSEIITKGYDTPTCSLVIRNEVATRFITFANTRPQLPYSDLYIKFFGTLRGGGIRINKQMAYNRTYANGSWSARYKGSPSFMISQSAKKIESLPELNRISRLEFQDAFTNEIYRNIRNVLTREDIRLKQKFLFYFKYSRFITKRKALKLPLAFLKQNISRFFRAYIYSKF